MCCCLWRWRTSACKYIFCLTKIPGRRNWSFYCNNHCCSYLGTCSLLALNLCEELWQRNVFPVCWTEQMILLFISLKALPLFFFFFFQHQEWTMYLCLCQQGSHGAILVSTGIACSVARRLIKSNSRWKWAFSCSSLCPAAISLSSRPWELPAFQTKLQM